MGKLLLKNLDLKKIGRKKLIKYIPIYTVPLFFDFLMSLQNVDLKRNRDAKRSVLSHKVFDKLRVIW